MASIAAHRRLLSGAGPHEAREDDADPRPIPLEFIVSIAPDVDGRAGSNRAPSERVQIQADDDIHAIKAFLKEYEHSPGTHRVYRRECERLLLWALIERGKPLSSLDRQDFDDYLAFVRAPTPEARWCTRRGPVSRSSADWRPFVGGLHGAAVMVLIAAVNSLMTYLLDGGYLHANPFALLRQKRRTVRAAETSRQNALLNGQPDPDVGASGNTSARRRHAAATGIVQAESAFTRKVERYLDESTWVAVQRAVEDMIAQASTPARALEAERARFIIDFLYLLYPRVSEMVGANMNSFRRRRNTWWWDVTGKGDKRASVPVPDAMMESLARYRRSLQLPARPTIDECAPLLQSVRSITPTRIHERRVNQILREVFNAAIAHLPDDDDFASRKAKLQLASAHWGRHTGITHHVATTDRQYVKRSARHEKAATTEGYIHEEDARWHEAMRHHRPPRGGKASS